MYLGTFYVIDIKDNFLFYEENFTDNKAQA